MKSPSISRLASARIALGVVTVVAVAVLASAVFARSAFFPALASLGSAPPQPAPVQDGPTGPTQDGPPPLILQLTSTGFAQDTIQVPAGDKILAIRNATGSDQLSFTITEPSLGLSQTVDVHLGARVDRIVTLKPGEWIVSEATHPEWSCHIVVTP